MPVTINQVAEAAGVSTSTVSRVFTAPEQVGSTSRDHVLRVARELGYTPSRTARSLARGTTGTLGLMVPNIENPFFPPVLKTVMRQALRKDYAVFLADSDEHPGEEAELAGVMAKQVDGLILWASQMTTAELREIGQRVPTVLVNRQVDGMPSVLVPSSDGMRQAVEHLHALGHRTCCFLNGPRTSLSNQRRRAAVRAACKAFGMQLIEFGPYDAAAQAGRYEASFHGGTHAAELLVASDATAAIAHNDVAALGILRQLRIRGVNVPSRVSIIGVDDISLATFAAPALTTVRIPVKDVASAAVGLILDQLRAEGKSQPAQVELATQLIIRDSTGPAPGAI